METRKIGALDVSVVGLGCNNIGRRLDAETSETLIHTSLDAGINFFDTADIYGEGMSETFIGRALANRRHEAVIATKFGHSMGGPERGASPAYIRQAIEASLQRLGTDWIDLYQLHTPDPLVPIADTIGALDALVKAGKIREYGFSQFSAAQLREAQSAVQQSGAARFASVQNEYSMLNREPEAEVLPECERLNIAFLPFFPLASGLLTGKYRRGEPLPEKTRIVASENTYKHWITEHNLDVVEALIAFAKDRGHTILDLAFVWLLAQPKVASVIAGAMSPEQVQTNAATVSTSWTLTQADLSVIDAILTR